MEDNFTNFTPPTAPEPILPNPLSEPELPKPPEEPELPPHPPPLPPSTSQYPAPPPKRESILGNLLLYLVLFLVGIGISFVVNQYFPNFELPKVPGQLIGKPSPTLAILPTTAPVWKTYQVISGTTKQPIAGISFQLPDDVLSPICDGANCASQGTYLPGGTRFTVAARGQGQLLPDFRGAQVSEVGGKIFTQKSATVSGLPAIEFTGTFAGTTVGGYAFTRMHGYMVASNGISLEINHFTPTGIAADFASDHILFEQIVKTFKF